MVPRWVGTRHRSACLREAIWARTAATKEDCFKAKPRFDYLAPSTILASLHCAGPAVFGCGQ